MKLFQLINLKCENENDRSLLIKAVKKLLKVDKLSKDDLQRICDSLEVKYNMPYRIFKNQRTQKYLLSIEVSRGTYSTANCNSKTEAYLKCILIIKSHLNIKKSMVPK